MEILKFDNSAPAPRKSAPKKSNIKSLAGLATVAAVAVLGSTLAANISLGSTSLEFGQGVQTTAACDSSITLTPKVIFVNSSTNPQFMLSTVSFTGIDAQAGKCQSKTFQLNAYGDSSATPLQLATTAASAALTTATIGISADGNSVTSAAGSVVAGLSGGASANLAFDLGFTTPSSTSGAVYKLTLQSN
ncbi:hypothetical protein MCEMRE182_01070 [Candidatus Nanopelagicaceae bacterium]